MQASAIQEADKIRTIYDGSIGGQNAKIQQHTKEKTTLPTVADCVQALHWCSAKAHTAAVGAEGRRTNRAPAAVGADQELKWCPPKPGEQWVILKTDASKVHRRIKVLQPDWRYQVAINKGKFWVNKVGTYGMASAPLLLCFCLLGWLCNPLLVRRVSTDSEASELTHKEKKTLLGPNGCPADQTPV